jgi:type IV secretory pathway VirB10-like protein
MEHSEPGRITDRRVTPAGVVPRHLQQWILVGVALVMVAIMALSGSPARSRSAATPAASTQVVDPNQQRIEEYRRRIQEQAQRLAAEQAQLQLAKDSAASANQPAPTTQTARCEVLGAGCEVAKAVTAPPDRAAREERGRFADNVAFSRSGGATTGQTARCDVRGAGCEVPAPTPTPTSQTARCEVRGAGCEVAKYRVLEGTFIDTVLTNRLDGTFPGPVNCLVSVPVYASDQQHLVIPAGARALGEARAVTTFGQSRLAVVFHRVILPNGSHIDLNGFHGLNQVGDLGLADQVDRHYAQIFGVSLAIGAIAGLAQARSGAGVDATALDAYRQGVSANVAQSSARILDRFLNLLPTVTIREGHRIKVYLSNDLELPAYHDTLVTTGGRP